MKNGKKGQKRDVARPQRGGAASDADPFQDFLDDFAADPDQPLKFLRSFMAGEEAYNPAVDVIEESERLVLIADLPGVAEKDLKIEFVEGGVVLRGQRAGAPEGKGSKLRRAERPAGEFAKNVPLPGGLDVERAQARMTDGVLTLVLPRRTGKQEGASPKAIKAGGDT